MTKNENHKTGAYTSGGACATGETRFVTSSRQMGAAAVIMSYAWSRAARQDFIFVFCFSPTHYDVCVLHVPGTLASSTSLLA